MRSRSNAFDGGDRPTPLFTKPDTKMEGDDAPEEGESAPSPSEPMRRPRQAIHDGERPTGLKG